MPITQDLQSLLDDANALTNAFREELSKTTIEALRFRSVSKRLIAGLLAIDETRRLIERQCTEKNFCQSINVIKFDHMMYKMQVYMNLLDPTTIPVVEDYHECNLGKWFYRESTNRDSALMAKLERLHRTYHGLVHEAINANTVNDWALAEVLLRPIDQLSDELLAALDELEQSECTNNEQTSN